MILSLIVVAVSCGKDGGVYQTTDIKDYGNFVGTYDDENLNKYITGFFPDVIQDHFDVVKYSYKAVRGDTISCEAYLEFTIEDEEKFDLYTSAITNNDKTNEFAYDTSFTERVFSDYLQLTSSQEGIERANIQKILYSDESNTVIFVFIMVHDGGYTRADAYDAYFSRFDIDLVEHYG